MDWISILKIAVLELLITEQVSHSGTCYPHTHFVFLYAIRKATFEQSFASRFFSTLDDDVSNEASKREGTFRTRCIWIFSKTPILEAKRSLSWCIKGRRRFEGGSLPWNGNFGCSAKLSEWEKKSTKFSCFFLSCGLWSFGFVVNSRELSHFVSRSSERSLCLSRTSRIILRKDDFAFIIIGVVHRATQVLGRGPQVYG